MGEIILLKFITGKAQPPSLTATWKVVIQAQVTSTLTRKFLHCRITAASPKRTHLGPEAQPSTLLTLQPALPPTSAVIYASLMETEIFQKSAIWVLMNSGIH